MCHYLGVLLQLLYTLLNLLLHQDLALCTRSLTLDPQKRVLAVIGHLPLLLLSLRHAYFSIFELETRCRYGFLVRSELTESHIPETLTLPRNAISN